MKQSIVLHPRLWNWYWILKKYFEKENVREILEKKKKILEKK